MKNETRIALANLVKNGPRLKAGIHHVDETVTLRVRGTIKVEDDTEAQETISWRQVAALAWGRLTTQDRLDIIEALNGERKTDTKPVEEELDSLVIREMKHRAGRTLVTATISEVAP